MKRLLWSGVVTVGLVWIIAGSIWAIIVGLIWIIVGLVWKKVAGAEVEKVGAAARKASGNGSLNEAKALSVKIGVAIAMSDGRLDDTEGKTIQSWMRQEISAYTNTKQQQELKTVYNNAMREAYEAARRDELILSEITSRLNQIGDLSTKYQALELCFDVLAADGVPDAAELTAIRGVSDAVGLDSDEFQKMRDQKIIGLDGDLFAQASIEDILGIDPSWGEERTRKCLKDELHKWNNRLMTLSEGQGRNNAQRMIDRISDAIARYAR